MSIFFHIWSFFPLWGKKNNSFSLPMPPLLSFYKIKDVSALFRLAFSKMVHDCPFKNCYTTCIKMKPTLLSVVRTVASRSICLSKLKSKRSNFQGQETILLFNVILRVKISEAQQPLLSCFKFYVLVNFCIFDWHI